MRVCGDTALARGTIPLMRDTGGGVREAMAAHTFAFVGGLHRSGTTPMARCLAEHPQVSGFHDTGVVEDEGQHLQSVYPPARTQGGPGRFALSARTHLTEESALATAENAQQLFVQWQRHWDLSRRVLLEKSPPNLVMSRFLQEMFPHPRFVMVVRHPVIVALSTKKWAPRIPLARLLGHWFRAHEVLCGDVPYVRSLHVVKYEHFVTAPVEALTGVGAVLGLDGPIPTGSIQPHRSSSYERIWRALLADRGRLRRRSMDRLVQRFEQPANDYGYSLLDLDRADPFPVPKARGASLRARPQGAT